jgi:ubiquinone/menaquinone biosynthesis C-methylase UbiE
MLSRVLEPEVMDSPEEARDYDAMDHSHVNRLFVDDFLSRWNGASPILDVGTGTAQIPIVLCQVTPAAQVTAVDLADHMLQLGAENVGKAGLESRIRLKLADAKRLPFPDAAFRAVISNSIVHHIPTPVDVLREMLRVLAPGGPVFVRDLLRPENERELDHLVATYAAGANAHQRQMFADSLRAALTLAEVRELVQSLGCPSDSVQQTSDRHWTWSMGT